MEEWIAAGRVQAPRTDLVQTESEMLQRYLERGGHVLVLLDPPADGGPPIPVLEDLLRVWDFQMGKDVVVDGAFIPDYRVLAYERLTDGSTLPRPGARLAGPTFAEWLRAEVPAAERAHGLSAAGQG